MPSDQALGTGYLPPKCEFCGHIRGVHAYNGVGHSAKDSDFGGCLECRCSKYIAPANQLDGRTCTTPVEVLRRQATLPTCEFCGHLCSSHAYSGGGLPFGACLQCRCSKYCPPTRLDGGGHIAPAVQNTTDARVIAREVARTHAIPAGLAITPERVAVLFAAAELAREIVLQTGGFNSRLQCRVFDDIMRAQDEKTVTTTGYLQEPGFGACRE